MSNYIIIGEYKDNKGISYVSNTNPICWVNEEYLAKNYEYLYEAINDIQSNYGTFKTTILGTDINYISILNTISRDIIPVIDYKGELLIDDDD